MVILHCGTNDLQQNLKTVDNLKQIHDYTKANSPKTKLVISTIITRKDNIELDKKVKVMNDRLIKFASKNDFYIIDNKNIDETCLNKKKLHLNRKGNSYLANNMIKFLKA